MTKRTGLLLLLLVFPVLIFLFLKFFGKNHYTLTKYYPLDVVSKETDGKVIQDTVFHTISGFSYISEEGDTVTEEVTKGKIYVADFFFTTCPGICPKMSYQLKRVQEAFLDHPEVLILSHTVDPETDSVKVLKEYAQAHHAIKGKWYFLTGAKDSIYDAAIRDYKIPIDEDSESQGADRFVHSERFILVDKEGRIRGYYNGTDEKDVDRLILEINVLRNEYGDKN